MNLVPDLFAVGLGALAVAAGAALYRKAYPSGTTHVGAGHQGGGGHGGGFHGGGGGGGWHGGGGWGRGRWGARGPRSLGWGGLYYDEPACRWIRDPVTGIPVYACWTGAAWVAV